jgi:hypothetical protein
MPVPAWGNPRMSPGSRGDSPGPERTADVNVMTLPQLQRAETANPDFLRMRTAQNQRICPGPGFHWGNRVRKLQECSHNTNLSYGASMSIRPDGPGLMFDRHPLNAMP